MSISIKRSGQRVVFISHNSARPFPIAYAAGRYCYAPAFPNPPVTVERKARPLNVFGQFERVAA